MIQKSLMNFVRSWCAPTAIPRPPRSQRLIRLVRIVAIAAGLGFGAASPIGSPPLRAGELKVTSDFCGGSAKIIALNQTTRRVRLAPATHEDRGWNCWWYVRISGITPGETITVEVGDSPMCLPQRATYSLDQRNWLQTGEGQRAGASMVYTQKIEGDTAWFAWGPPFTSDDAEELVERASYASPHASRFVMTYSREGKKVCGLRIAEGGAGDRERYGVFVSARQHAWEAGSSWVCRGLTEWLLSDEPRAIALRRKSCFTIVPVMDVDNVAAGAGGKEEKPHDHNRDWSNSPRFPAVRAAMSEIMRQDADHRFDVFLDLHCPTPADKQPFFFVAPRSLLSERGERNLDRFLASAREDIQGELCFRGQTYESGPQYDAQWESISKNWVARHTSDHVASLTLETPWDTPHSTAKGYMTVGRQLGEAVERYLRFSPRE